MEPFFIHRINDRRIARIDGRIKILVALGLLIMILSFKGLAFPLLVTTGFIFVCIGLKVPTKVLAVRLAEPLFVGILVLLIKIFGSGREVLFSINAFSVPIVGRSDGLRDGLVIVGRMLGAFSVVVLLSFCTPLTEFAAGLSWLRLPKALIEILLYTYRFAFILLEEAAVIYNAQKNRFGYSSLWRGCNSFGILAASLTLKAFDHTQVITSSMIQRGYDGNMPLPGQRPFVLAEILAGILFFMISGTIWLLLSGY